MKLYGVFRSYKGTMTMEACEVEEETSKFYILQKASFTYDKGKRIPKNHPMLAFSPAAAVGKFIARNSRKIADSEGRLKALNKAARDAQELLGR